MKDSQIRTKEEVERFLSQFFPKMDIWGIFFLNRDKNHDALAALGIVPKERERYVREIEAESRIKYAFKDEEDKL